MAYFWPCLRVLCANDFTDYRNCTIFSGFFVAVNSVGGFFLVWYSFHSMFQLPEEIESPARCRHRQLVAEICAAWWMQPTAFGMEIRVLIRARKCDTNRMETKFTQSANGDRIAAYSAFNRGDAMQLPWDSSRWWLWWQNCNMANLALSLSLSRSLVYPLSSTACDMGAFIRSKFIIYIVFIQFRFDCCWTLTRLSARMHAILHTECGSSAHGLAEIDQAPMLCCSHMCIACGCVTDTQIYFILLSDVIVVVVINAHRQICIVSIVVVVVWLSLQRALTMSHKTIHQRSELQRISQPNGIWPRRLCILHLQLSPFIAHPFATSYTYPHRHPCRIVCARRFYRLPLVSLSFSWILEISKNAWTVFPANIIINVMSSISHFMLPAYWQHHRMHRAPKPRASNASARTQSERRRWQRRKTASETIVSFDIVFANAMDGETKKKSHVINNK